jgi:hypothetical protein
MKVRDLRQYISEITGTEYSVSNLGSHREPFLVYIAGQYQSVEQVKGFIESSSSFATNAEEQLFYEFVQNAYDAKADSLYFFANEKYLIVLNNGEPFYTDFDLLADEKNNGQLFNFLAKGKSDKRGDDDQMGQYGQGSKLLYTLITDSSDGQLTDAELLVEAIYDNKKGPYLISWNSKDQLTNLLYSEQNWELSQADDYKNNILFAKILYSYYPIAPGQELSLFSNKEASEVISVFDKLVDPRRNLQYMNKGTALVIPLGKGKAAKINDKSNIAKVRTRLGGFSALTAETMANSTKLKHIFVLNEEIEQADVVSVFWQKMIGKKNQKFHLAFNPIFAQDGYVNFFKGLPILSTRHHLGFIIDSQCFQTDDSRQRLTNTDTVEHQLTDIFTELVSRLKVMKSKEPEKFGKVYDAIMACRIEKDEDSAFIMRPFNAVLKPFLQDNVRTDGGKYLNQSNVFLSATKYDFEIPLSALGVDSKSWVDPAIKKSLSYMGISLSSLDLKTVITETVTTKLNKWIKDMSDKDYAAFQAQCRSLTQQGILLNTKLFRSDKKDLFTYNELIGNSPIYYGYGDVSFNGLEHLPVNFSGQVPYEYPLILFKKIQSQLSTLRANNVLKDTTCKMLIYIAQKRLDLKDSILNLQLFENRQGNLCAFNDLFAEVPADSCLFDDFQVSGYLPDSIKQSGWMLDPKKDASKAWEWVVGHIGALIKVEGWDIMVSSYIDDLRSLYNLVPKEENPSYISNLYFNASGMPTTIAHSMVKNISKINEGDYETLKRTFTDIQFLPYQFYKKLSSAPFNLNKLDIYDLLEDGKQVNKEQLILISKLEDGFLRHYYLKETSGGFRIYSLNDGQNYVNELDHTLETALANNGFYHIPESAQDIFSDCTVSTDYNLANNTQLMLSIVQQFDVNALMGIFPLIEKSNDTVLSSYYLRLPELSIDSKLNEKDIKWRIIDVATKRSNSNGQLKNIVFNKIRHNNSRLADEIVDEIVNVSDRKYDIYALDGDYKASNSQISSFLECLPDGKVQFFKKEFYDGKQTSIDARTVYLGIYQRPLTLEQLRFCLDYVLTNNLEGVKFTTLSSVGTAAILDMVEAHKFNGFDKYYTLSGFNSMTQVYAESDILLDKEKLPIEIYSWLKNHQDGCSLFNILRTSGENLMRYRRSIKEGKRHTGLSFLSTEDHINDTLEWLLSQRIICAKDSDQYKNLIDFINGLPDDFGGMPFFQFVGDVSLEADTNTPKVNLRFCLYTIGKPFLYGAGLEFAECLSTEQNLKLFIKNSSVYEHPGAANIYKHHLTTNPVWDVKHGFENGNYKEFDYNNYKVWKGMRESNGVTLFTSDKPIGLTLGIYHGKDELISVRRKDSEYGSNDVTKQVIIRYPNADKLSKMKTLEKHSKGISWLKDPLIALLGLYVNETDELQKIADERGMDIKEVVEVAKSTIEGTGMDASTLKVIQESPEAFKNIASAFDESTLKKIGNNTSVIQSLLDEFNKNELSVISSLSANVIKKLAKVSQDDLELYFENSDKFKTWLSSGSAYIDCDMVDMFTKFTDGFDYETPEELNEQLVSLHDTYTRFGKDGWNKFRQNTDTVVDIVDKFSEDELKKIAEASQDLHDFLEELEKDKQNDRDSSISSIIGYIGELIYEQYLVQNKIKYEFSADNGISQYDFIVYPSTSGKERYVDVKTTRNTLTDGHSPMYIHKAQDEFLKSHPGVIYRFIRVSLHDLRDELEKEYELLRDQYGSGADPRDPNNVGLRKECQDIAKKYWLKANISDFEDVSPVYRIEYVNP